FTRWHTTIINLEREDTGTYKCTASNYIGIITAVAQVLPTFVTTPENLTTKSGSLARLRCVAEGSPAPVITWFKDGNTVTPATRFSILEGGSTLEIRDLKESDSGLYTCLAQNQVGSAEANADLRVKGFGSRPPRILLRPYPISAPLGTSIELPCKADGDPVPVITWQRDGVKLVPDRTH
ncbi:peroxidasin homolog, partial [Nilaparvata lugens]|uniref:peroxidasin homolog n=1 Tax=Nilaparvata lugens TaxID=108931 RepID=UPI00193DABE4